jgi:hypothetical protein
VKPTVYVETTIPSLEEVWRIRDELAAEEGNDPRKVFDILRGEERKYGDRVRPVRKPAESLALREESSAYAAAAKRKKRSPRK